VGSSVQPTARGEDCSATTLDEQAAADEGASLEAHDFDGDAPKTAESK
jgi:hypothetical protein